jgi:hypothetical protein
VRAKVEGCPGAEGANHENKGKTATMNPKSSLTVLSVAVVGLALKSPAYTQQTPPTAQTPAPSSPAATPSASASVSAEVALTKDDWREQYAYSVGVQAYIYAFPLLYLTQLRHKWATDATSVPYVALDLLYHFRNVADASYKGGGSPNKQIGDTFASASTSSWSQSMRDADRLNCTRGLNDRRAHTSNVRRTIGPRGAEAYALHTTHDRR